MNTGVDVIATAHGSSIDEVMKRPNVKKLIDAGVFKKAVVLQGKNEPCKVKGIVEF
jgi:stage III sporulation protein AA